MNIEKVTLSGHTIDLVPLSQRHAEGLCEASQHAEIWRYMPVPMPDLEGTREIIRTALAEQRRLVSLPFAIVEKSSGRVVGCTRYMSIWHPHRQLEIGYTWLAPEVWRTNINTECKYLLLRHAFETLEAVRVQLKTDSRNFRSQTAILRLGATREGILRKHMIRSDGFIRDTVMFSIIEAEWPAVKSRLEKLLERPERKCKETPATERSTGENPTEKIVVSDL